MTGVLIRRGERAQEQGTSLVIQWLGFCASNAGGPGSIPGQGTRVHMEQLRVCMAKQKILHALMKSRCSQIKINK